MELSDRVRLLLINPDAEGGLRYRPGVDQSLVKVSPQEDELDELKRKPFTEWKF
jgi:hypothetical protein